MVWFARLARPQLLLALLVVMAALVLWTLPVALKRDALREFEIVSELGGDQQSSELRLIIIDDSGLERPRFVEVVHGPSPAARLAALSEALRTELLRAGVWPDGLPAPTVFLVEVGRTDVAVLDFADRELSLSVGQERQLVASLRETMLSNGVDAVRFLVGGEPRPAPLGHVAVPTGL